MLIGSVPQIWGLVFHICISCPHFVPQVTLERLLLSIVTRTACMHGIRFSYHKYFGLKMKCACIGNGDRRKAWPSAKADRKVLRLGSKYLFGSLQILSLSYIG